MLLNITLPEYNRLDEIVQELNFASSASASWGQVINLSRLQFGNHKFRYLVQSGTTNSQWKEIHCFRG